MLVCGLAVASVIDHHFLNDSLTAEALSEHIFQESPVFFIGLISGIKSSSEPFFRFFYVFHYAVPLITALSDEEER